MLAATAIGVCLYAAVSVPVNDRSNLTHFRQGWPLPYVTRCEAPGASLFTVWSNADDWRWLAAVADISVALGLSVVAWYLVGGVVARLFLKTAGTWRVVCLGVLAVLLSVAVWQRVVQHRIERRAVAELEHSGWKVYWNDGVAVPEYLYRVIVDMRFPGRERLRRVGHVEWLRDDQVLPSAIHPDDMLATLEPVWAKLPSCNSVVVKDPRLTDRGTVALCDGLPDCRFLELESSAITNASVKRIGESWPTLEYLVICGARISDAGLRHLEKCPQLEVVKFCDCREISADGILRLSRNPRIKTIGVPMDMPLTDKELFTILERGPDRGVTFLE